jgi:hypothetical protein
VIATIDAEARDDKEEVQRLVKSCQKKNYRQNDMEYTETMHNLMFIALGVECEINRNALGFIAGLYLDYGVIDKFLQNMIDIRTAWEETLKSMGIKPETMNQAAPLKPFFTEFIDELLPKPDPENVASIVEVIKNCFQVE